MANTTSPPAKLLDVVKNDIEMKMKNDYINVSKVIRKMDDKTMKKETIHKLLEAYIRKDLELQNINTILDNLLKKKDLVDVYIPGFELDARKYIFKNPDPFGYKMMTETDNLMPVADFIWVMLSNETYNQMKDKMKTSPDSKLSECLKYWQITGQLIEMFSKRDQIDLTFFFNFDKHREQIKSLGSKNGFPFKQVAKTTGNTNKRTLGKNKKDQKKKPRNSRGPPRRDIEDILLSRLDGGTFERRNKNTFDRRNKNTFDRRNKKPMSQSGPFVTPDFLNIFKRIGVDIGDKRITIYNELNDLIKNAVQNKKNTMGNNLYKNMVVDYEKYVEKDKSLIETHLNTAVGNNCSIEHLIGLTQEIDSINDIYNLDSLDKNGITYDKEMTKKYFTYHNFVTLTHQTTAFQNEINHATNFSIHGHAEHTKYPTTNSIIQHAKPTIDRIPIPNSIRFQGQNICYLGDILKPDFFSSNNVNKLKEKTSTIIRKHLGTWIKNITFNKYAIDKQFELYRFESLNYIQTISRTQLKTLLMRISNYLISYYSFFTKEYVKYQKTLIDDFGIDPKDVKEITTRVKATLPFISKNKAITSEPEKPSKPEPKIDNKFKNKQEAIDRITRLITKYKDEPAKLTELKELLKKARAL